MDVASSTACLFRHSTEIATVSSEAFVWSFSFSGLFLTKFTKFSDQVKHYITFDLRRNFHTNNFRTCLVLISFSVKTRRNFFGL